MSIMNPHSGRDVIRSVNNPTEDSCPAPVHNYKRSKQRSCHHSRHIESTFQTIKLGSSHESERAQVRLVRVDATSDLHVTPSFATFSSGDAESISRSFSRSNSRSTLGSNSRLGAETMSEPPRTKQMSSARYASKRAIPSPAITVSTGTRDGGDGGSGGMYRGSCGSSGDEQEGEGGSRDETKSGRQMRKRRAQKNVPTSMLDNPLYGVKPAPRKITNAARDCCIDHLKRKDTIQRRLRAVFATDDVDFSYPSYLCWKFNIDLGNKKKQGRKRCIAARRENNFKTEEWSDTDFDF